MDEPRQAYRQLLERLDVFFAHAADRYAQAMRCGPGCDDCCRRDLEVHAFEVERILAAIDRLPPETVGRLEARARDNASDEEAPCPLLEGGRCLAYDVRPVICRTHGLPLLLPGDGSLSVCPHNFHGVEHIDGDCVLNLEPVNQILATVSALLSKDAKDRASRVLVSRAILERGCGESEV